MDEKSGKKDITLINVGFPTKRDILRFYVPMGVLWLAAYLEKAGYRPDVLDYQVYRPGLDNSLPETLAGFMESAGTDVIGISVISKDLPLVLVACEIFKRKHPGKTILLGGPGPSGVAGDIMEKFPFINLVAVGEGEMTLVELMNQLNTDKPDFSLIDGLIFRKDGKIITNPRRERMENLEEVPRPSYHLLDKRVYNAMYVSGSRGCSHFCTFCDQPVMWSGREVRRPVELMVKELDYLMEELKVKWTISFSDNEFCHQKDRFDQFVKLMKSRSYHFPFAIDRRIDAIDTGVLRAARSVGCITLLYGIESGSSRVLKKIKKEFTPDKIIPGLNLSSRYITHNVASLMFGFPFEEIGDFLDTVNLIWRTVRRKNANYITYQLHYLSPLPRTAIFAKYKDRLVRREIVNLMNSGNNFDTYDVIGMEKEKKLLVLPKTRGEKVELDSRVEKMVTDNPETFPTFYLYDSPRIDLKEYIIEILKVTVPRKFRNLAFSYNDLTIHLLNDLITVSGPPDQPDLPAVLEFITAADLKSPHNKAEEMARRDKLHLVSFDPKRFPENTGTGDALLELLNEAARLGVNSRVISYLPPSMTGFSTRLKLSRDFQAPEHPSQAADLLIVNEEGRVTTPDGRVGEDLGFYPSQNRMFNAFYGNVKHN